MLRQVARNVCRQVGIARHGYAVVAKVPPGGSWPEYNPDDIKSLDDWPKVSDEQWAKWENTPRLTPEQKTANFDLIESRMISDEEKQAFAEFKASCQALENLTTKALADAEKYKDTDWAHYREVFLPAFGEGHVDEFIESLQEYKVVWEEKAKTYKYHNPDLPAFNAWMDTEIEKFAEQKPRMQKIIDLAKERIAEIEDFKARYNELTISEYLQFVDPKKDYDFMEQTIHRVLAQGKAEHGYIPDWIQEKADKDLAMIAEERSKPSLEEQIDARVRAGEWWPSEK